MSNDEIVKPQKLTKAGKVDKRAFNSPIENAKTARQRLSYLLKRGKQVLTDEKKTEIETDEPEPVPVPVPVPVPEKKKPSKDKKTKSKKVVIKKPQTSEDDDTEDDTEDDTDTNSDDEPVIILKKRPNRKKYTKLKEPKNEVKPMVDNVILDRLTKMEQLFLNKEIERQEALNTVKHNSELINNTRQRMLLKF